MIDVEARAAVCLSAKNTPHICSYNTTEAGLAWRKQEGVKKNISEAEKYKGVTKEVEINQ